MINAPSHFIEHAQKMRTVSSAAAQNLPIFRTFCMLMSNAIKRSNVSLANEFAFAFVVGVLGFVSIGASSEACENYRNVRVVDTMWYHNMLRGVTILPKQHLNIDKWVTFNNLPSNLNPLYSATPIDLESHADTETIHILLETQVYPDLEAIESGAKIVSVSRIFG